jgi:pyochelin synthetase
MTLLPALLDELGSRGIFLFLEEGAMRYRSPRGALTATDRDVLQARKGEIVDYLKAREAGRSLRTLKGEAGPLTPALAQEMWWRFAGAPDEGKPIALNIGMVRRFEASPARLTQAIGAVLARHEALRVGFRAEGETLIAHANDIGDLVIEQDSARPEDAMKLALDYCGRLNPILGQWLTRAKVIALPDGSSMCAISAAHMIADFGARNILVDELQDWLDGKPAPSPSVDFNSYSLAERRILEGPQGSDLIAHWRDWYAAQPVTATPSGSAMLWGNGTRLVCNFAIPRHMMDRARARAEDLKTTPFGLFMTLYAVVIARWAGIEEFPLRVLADKRLTLETAGTVGLMFCADAVSARVPRDADFETILRGLLSAHEAAVVRRIPSLHFYAPQMVRPGIEPPGFPNRIPAVFNYYPVGTLRERAEKLAEPDADLPWPPQVTQVTQVWPRVSSPLFLHLMDYGAEAQVSLHFYADVVPQEDRESFIALLLKMFGEMLAA